MSPNPARSFGTVANQYERSRPGYPEAALLWLLGSVPLRVVDLGAGTGKLTAALVGLGHDVVAVEPDDAMRAILTTRLPSVVGLEGSAEAIPLPDFSVDAVVAGQAYHWFDRSRALPEISRVLRPRGVLGLLWNVRDEGEPWVRELTIALQAIGDDRPNMHPPPDADQPWFTDYESRQFAHSVPCNPNLLRDLITSRSYVITATPPQRLAVVAAIDDLLDRHPALAERSEFPLPYVTHTYRAARR